MNNVYEITLLLDFYGQLLTTRQYEILDLHYNNDYSLGEIAEEFGISRQGVYDNIKRGREMLNQLEHKLGLVSKFSQQKYQAGEIVGILHMLDKNSMSEENAKALEKVTKMVCDMVNI